jgi:hypothetical protein
VSEQRTITSPDLKALARHNEKVDLKKLQKSRQLQDSLKEQGYQPKGYQLASPFDRERSIHSKKRSVKETSRL